MEADQVLGRFYVDDEGFVQFPDGSKYKGPLKNGNPEGVGIIIYPDGSRYEGDWKAGNSHGFGILSFPDGSKYEGSWNKGKYHGKGIYSTSSGAKYDGDWQLGKYHGIGTFVWPDGSVYKGEWRNCRENGRGKFTGINGTVYEGEWQDGKYNGKGKLVTPDGKMYVGLFKNGKYITAGVEFVELMDSLAQKNDCFFWNWYDLSGGYGTIKTWNELGYARKDGIHLTHDGYKIKGKLLFQSIINTLRKIETNKEKVEFHSDLKFYELKKQSTKIKSNNISSKNFHRVKAGETLSSIARKYNISVKKIKELNQLQIDIITPGEALKIK
jgi:LysM repeat protein